MQICASGNSRAKTQLYNGDLIIRSVTEGSFMTKTQCIHNPIFTTSAVAAIATFGLALSTVPAAQAVTLITTETAGTFETLVSRNPGVYGFEARGGYASSPARTWEVGVGTHTSQPGDFAQGDINWLDDNDVPILYDFALSWKPGSAVTATIGDQTVTYQADWQVGNAVEFMVKRQSYFKLTEFEGVAFDYEVNQLERQTKRLTEFWLTGDSLLDGWDLKGQIALTPHRNASYNEVFIKPVTFTPAEEPEAVPEPGVVLGLGALLGLGVTLRQNKTD